MWMVYSFTLFFTQFVNITDISYLSESLTQCCYTCIRKTGCRSFFYNSRKHICLASAKKYLEPKRLTVDSEYAYFITRSESKDMADNPQFEKKPSGDNEDVTETGQSGCIVYKNNSITIDPSTNSRLLELPVKVLPGMMLSLYGGYNKHLPYSQVTITKDPVHATRMWSWLHIRPEFKHRRVAFTDGLSNYYYEGKFPISDPDHFTIALELTESSTKIFIDKILVRTMDLIPWIVNINLRKYGKVYQLEVQKTGEKC